MTKSKNSSKKKNNSNTTEKKHIKNGNKTPKMKTYDKNSSKDPSRHYNNNGGSDSNNKIKKASSPNQHRGDNNNNTLQSPKPIITDHKSPSMSLNARIPNSDFIPINKITPKELRELEKYHTMISPDKKRRFNNFEVIDDWRKPSPNELPWMKDDGDRKYRDVVHRMHFELNDLINYLSPTEVEKTLRVFVIKRIENAIKAKIPYSEMLIFGSFNSGIYLPTSDIDIVVFGHVKMATSLYQLADYLMKKKYSYGKPLVIQKAVVPIIKFKEQYTNINIDISFNQKTVFKSVNTISRHLKEWPILGKLLLVLKCFLKHHNLDDPSNGGMGGYTLFCMILSFLQLHPRITDGTLRLDDDNLGVLLIEFFELYGTQFNYTDLAIIIRHGGSYRLKCQQGWAAKYPTTNLCIQDPSDPDNDIARATRNMVEIQKAFKQAFLRLINRVGQLKGVIGPMNAKYATNIHNRSILSSILFVPEDVQSLRKQLLRDYNENGLNKLVQQTSDDLVTLLKPCDYEVIAKRFEKEIEESDYQRHFRVNSILGKRKPVRDFRSQNYKDRNLNKDDYYFEALDSDY